MVHSTIHPKTISEKTDFCQDQLVVSYLVEELKTNAKQIQKFLFVLVHTVVYTDNVYVLYNLCIVQTINDQLINFTLKPSAIRIMPKFSSIDNKMNSSVLEPFLFFNLQESTFLFKNMYVGSSSEEIYSRNPKVKL